ncbi:beta-galactosidase [Granulicella sp. dw_53]|uniref:beta-galactosidase n=1 Tax=Granulicella sp. dw_53 TaxID=2719792 RepID=UPI001C49E0C2|nr:beta-galactosidase [Granulicella sp. dw_53]
MNSRLATLILCAVSLTCSTANTQAVTPSAPPALVLGAAWYPEQWPESRWDADLDLMQKAGITMVRVGEFAWSRMEPSDGHYDLDWLDNAVTAAGRHGIYTVIGTPSAAPPAWLTQKYPETLRTLEDGRKDQHGNRQQFNWANPKYRQLSRGMAEQLAKRFGHNPWVIGWQIDNEYANVSFDDATKAQFQDWLKARYSTLDNLNARWTTSYWSETYSNWNQVPIETKYGNPGLLLSWMRFVSDTWRSYQKNQTEVIRANSEPRQFITTNMMGWFDGYDHYTVSQDLDLASWDDYVGQGQLDPYRNGAAHDLTRGFLRKNFWVMETQPGFVNWQKINNSLDKGEVRAMAWHAIGHGADAVSYWQWRSALNGQEQYHGTLVGPDGTPVPLYTEVAQLGAEFAKAAPALAGTSVKSDVAILHSYDSRWAINWQRHNTNYDPVSEIVSYYKPLRDLSQSVDIVSPSVSLTQYKLVVAPGLNVLSDAEAKNLIAYVEQGGNLVLGQRTAMKDADNTLQTQRQPGPLASILGGRVEQYYALTDPIPVYGAWTEGSKPTGNKTVATKTAATSSDWAELLSTQSPDTKVLLRFGKSNGWLDDQPAAITRKVGKGSITYIGAYLDPTTMTKAAKWMLDISHVQPKLGKLPEGIDVYPREGPNGKVYILVNFNKSPQTITLPTPMQDILNGGTKTTLTLPTYGVSVLSTQ